MKIIKILIVLLLLAGAAFFGIRYYHDQMIEKEFLKHPSLFSAYAYSIDDKDSVTLYQNPENMILKTFNLKSVPDELFQESVSTREKLDVLDTLTVETMDTMFELRFCLVRTPSGGYGYIPDYRLCDINGIPLNTPPKKGTVY